MTHSCLVHAWRSTVPLVPAEGVWAENRVVHPMVGSGASEQGVV